MFHIPTYYIISYDFPDTVRYIADVDVNADKMYHVRKWTVKKFKAFKFKTEEEAELIQQIFFDDHDCNVSVEAFTPNPFGM